MQPAIAAPPPKLVFCGLAVVFFASVTPTAATDHIVGADKGWKRGINYTQWANNQAFYVNDSISFRYQKTLYNVLEVNQSGYDKCTAEGAVGNWSSGEDLIRLTKAKNYFFICSNAGHCFHGMKLSFLVHRLPPPSPPPEATPPADKSWSSWMNVVTLFKVNIFLIFFVWCICYIEAKIQDVSE